MTRARALKEIIRIRAARTGERYTTARRHVLSSLQPRTPNPLTLTPRPVPVVRPLAKAAATRGAVSDEKSLEKTGYDLDHWFEVLDKFGAVEKGHTAAARLLYDVHKVPGWYAQGITVAYERVRGVRGVNQRCDGDYEVSASKVVSASVTDVVKALTAPRLRKRWASGLDAPLVTALAAALDHKASKGIIVRPDGLGRYRYKWGNTTVQLYLQPKPGGKVSVVATNGKLADAAMVEARRAQWREMLNALARLYPATKKRAV
jgi:hypothetical protein